MLARLLTFTLILVATATAAIPTPEAFAGFPLGSDGNLLRWERIVEYFEILDRDSKRVQVRTLGKTNDGNPFLLAIISSPDNLKRLGEIQKVQHRLAHPAGLGAKEIEDLAWSSPAVVAVSCNIHATEIAASQMAVELAYRMATDNSRWTQNVLDNVVLLLVPSLNPDGQIIVTDWNDRVRGTENVWSSLPWLYHPYVGHDNNRDAYMMTQPESRYMNRILFQDWFPQVYLDEHQQGQSGMRVFVPPFRNPINPNVDPGVWAGAGQIGFAMYRSLHDAGFSGVGYDANYTAWWQGGFLRGAWFHNMVGMLTEVASANLASPTYQMEAKLGQPGRASKSRAEWLDEREKDPAAAMPAPTDVMPRYDYPRPWLGGKWTLRDIIDAELALTNALLETSANDRVRLIETQVRMGLDAIAEGEKGEPWAFVFPAQQHDNGAAYRLLEALRFCGVEVEQAPTAFTADGKEYAAGSYVIRMAQPFRAYAKDLLEPQRHPDPRDLPPGKMGDQPYDLTTWSLPLQMGVAVDAVKAPFEARLENLETIPKPQGHVEGSGRGGLLVTAGPNAAARFANRVWKAGGNVSPQQDGALWASGAALGELRSWAEELGLQARALDEPPAAATPRKQPRVALYRPWTASMDEGWTRWLLEQYEFAFSTVRDTDLQQPNLRERWDVILLPGDRSDSSLISGNTRKSTPEEFRGGLEQKGRAAIRDFVSDGGTLVVWGDAVEFATRTFELPLRDTLATVPRSEFSCPGSYLRVQVDTGHPVAAGMPAEATVVFEDDAAFEPLPGFSYTSLEVIARYPADGILESGWIRGERHLAHRIAAAQVRYKKGRVIL
ncbi:MAG: hypothetical protein KDC27_10250, partial [Acidobacteria bacterium]|nr:hypothetical protein [Acidobacteriota bacterium]